MPAPMYQTYTNGNKGGPGGLADYTAEDIPGLVDNLVAWTELPDSIVFRKWAAIHGFSYDTITNFCNKYEVFRRVYHKCKYIVGCRREEMLAKGELIGKLAENYHALYDPEYRAWLKELKSDAAEVKAQYLAMTRGTMNAIVQDKPVGPTDSGTTISS